MVQKPKIQYVGQFYVHGSEARKLELLEKKQAKTRLPMERLQKIEKIYVDPVAILGIVVAIVMLAVMVVGVMQIQEDWAEYEQMSSYVSSLKKTHADKAQEYRDSYDLEDIRTKAHALGLIPKEEAKTMTIVVTMPEPEPTVSRIDEIKWFLEGLFA
ncbi:MAG: hypothetical protein IJB59_00235 [Oscillospiraceae bacterium]|nr:hypothetical protein [Oscillospiraceae bacterium]